MCVGYFVSAFGLCPNIDPETVGYICHWFGVIALDSRAESLTSKSEMDADGSWLLRDTR